MSSVSKITAALVLLVSSIVPELNGSEHLDSFWPINMKQRGWRLVDLADGKRHMMTITHTKVDDTSFRVWFFDKPGQASGECSIEQFRLCGIEGNEPWLWLDKYINHNQKTGGWSEHSVQSTKILLTPDGGATQDLIANGTYAKYGGRGQPYLLFNQKDRSYRIQVWGTIGRDKNANSRWKWYWDASVYPAEDIRVGGLNPPRTIKAIKVKEAWWDNFKVRKGAWTAPGGGDVDKAGLPTGGHVNPFRTVWHGGGKLPYLVIGTPNEAPNWSTSQIWDVPQNSSTESDRRAEQVAAGQLPAREESKPQ